MYLVSGRKERFVLPFLMNAYYSVGQRFLQTGFLLDFIHLFFVYGLLNRGHLCDCAYSIHAVTSIRTRIGIGIFAKVL
jgi:hypothetical protein